MKNQRLTSHLPKAYEKLSHTQERVVPGEDKIRELDVNWEVNFLPQWRPHHQFPKPAWATLNGLLLPIRVSRAKAAPSPKQTQTPKLLEAWARARKSPRPSPVLRPEGPVASLYHPHPSLQSESKRTSLPPSRHPARNLCLGLGTVIRNWEAGCPGRGHGRTSREPCRGNSRESPRVLTEQWGLLRA